MQTHLKTPIFFSRPRTAAQRGQTIVIALLVLLLLAFLGGLFATIVTRNLANAGRSNRVQSADYYAEAGIRFADDQLTDSLDGADWRPALQAQLSDGTNGTPNFLPKDPIGLARYNAIKGTLRTLAQTANDPDHDYLVQGFSRFNIGGGRYLLRVTYDPVGINNSNNTGANNTPYSDPRARYIKIESVGREGTVDSQDPTTYQSSPRTQLNATLIQYKAIGITDYARFETNPDNRSDTMSLGVASQFSTNTNTIVTPGVYDFPGAASTLQQYPIITTYGATDAYLTSGGQLLPNPKAGTGSNVSNVVPGGGSIHVNGNVRFYGENELYLNNSNTATNGFFGDTIEVAGNILLDNYVQPAVGATTETLNTGQDAALIVNPATTGPVATDYVGPSNDPLGFDTHGGKVRDGNGGNDAQGEPRSVNRLDPPTLDTVNPVTNLPRYASITENSPPRATEDSANGTGAPTSYAGTSPALYGYGQSIYVDNTTDIQPESSSIVGGYTLIDEWLHRAGADAGAGSKSGWVANFYRPPGVDVTLGRQVTTLSSGPVSFYGIRLVRTDVDGAGNLIGWKNPNGNPITGINNDGTTQTTMTVSYKSLNASNDPTTVPATGTAAYSAYQANPNNDVIIYAAGNVRVHGVVSAEFGNSGNPGDPGPETTYAGGGNGSGSANDDDHLPRHVTIVTNGTAYIDGSLLRGNPQSTITVLAHDYVCVNTTQFLAGPIVDQNPAGMSQPGAYVGDPSLHALDFAASDEELIQEFTLPLGPSGNPLLYVSGGPSAPGGTAVDFDILDPRQPYVNEGLGGPPFTNPVLFSAANANILQPAQSFGLSYDTTGTGSTDMPRTTMPLPAGVVAGSDSIVYQLAMRRDQGGDSSLNSGVNLDTEDFLLERAAVLPMDIRIEAVLFAQTRSFFVIPGDWFNSNSSDNVLNYKNSSAGPTGLSRPGIDTTIVNQNRFPFFGQPIDMKIIVDGSISEARPADITAQSAWMAKWGWIPLFHGGLIFGAAAGTEPAGHTGPANTPALGLQIIYNPLAGYPYYTDSLTAPTVADYLRTDIYGRPLPYAPKLPVCSGLLYAGQNTGESVLQ